MSTMPGSSDAGADNPLLAPRADPEALPRFPAIEAAHIVPAIESRVAAVRAAADRAAAGAGASWECTVAPLEDAHDELDRSWAPVRHLHAVADSQPWREAYNACVAKLSELSTELGQRADLYEAYRNLAESEGFADLDRPRRKVVEDALRDFRLSGVSLPEAEKARFRELSAELSALTSRFGEQVLDAGQAWTKAVDDPARLAGLPASTLALAEQTARERGGEAGWLLTLDFPLYLPVMQHARDRELRREAYTAFATRASDEGPDAGRWDNGPLIREIVGKRQEMAALLGFASFAHYSLERKMAETPEQVLGFLRDLAARARPVAQREVAELTAFAAERYGYERLEAWDVPFVTERMREERYALSQEDLRPYLPLPRVLDGLFAIVERLFGMRVERIADPELWHPDAQAFELQDAGGARRGRFLLDPYARLGKRGGAWMDECTVRRRGPLGVQTPVAFLSCNFSPPVDGKPALLTHDEALTLFHEFGHGLHHVLTLVEHPAVSGINGVAWDAVELPSQLMENWCWEPEGLALLSGHVESGEPLPPETVERLRAARGFLAGMQMVRQLELSLFDIRLHLERGREADFLEMLEAVRDEVAVVRPPAFNRFPHSFTHVFAGGYAAGYYSYKWAEVLAADAFDLFLERGLFDRGAGEALLHAILERGGAEDAMDLYREFRGREPTVDALLRQHGIAVGAEPGSARP